MKRVSERKFIPTLLGKQMKGHGLNGTVCERQTRKTYIFFLGQLKNLDITILRREANIKTDVT